MAKQPDSHAPSPSTRTTTVLYTRIPVDLHAAIVRAAKKRGWPHTVASVAAEALAARFK